MKPCASQLGQRLAYRLADDGRVADEAAVQRVRQVEDVVGSPQHGDRRRRLPEHTVSSVALALDGRAGVPARRRALAPRAGRAARSTRASSSRAENGLTR